MISCTRWTLKLIAATWWLNEKLPVSVSIMSSCVSSCIYIDMNLTGTLFTLICVFHIWQEIPECWKCNRKCNIEWGRPTLYFLLVTACPDNAVHSASYSFPCSVSGSNSCVVVLIRQITISLTSISTEYECDTCTNTLPFINKLWCLTTCSRKPFL